MDETEHRHPLDDRIATSFARTVTRRTFLQRAARWSLAAGGALSGAVALASRAEAVGRCQFTDPEYGNYCNLNTPTCGSIRAGTCNEDFCVNGAVARCTRWTSFPYCWCSSNSCIGSHRGYFSCCDCWAGGFKDSCNPRCKCGYTPCLCGVRVFTGPC